MLGTSKSVKWVTVGSTLGIPSADDVFFRLSQAMSAIYVFLAHARSCMNTQ